MEQGDRLLHRDGLPRQFVPFQAPSATYEADGVTYNLLIVEGKPQREGGSLGAAGPGGTRAQADRNLVDGTVLGRAPPKTDTAEDHGRRGPAQQAGGHPAGDPVHGGGRRGVEGPQEIKVKAQRSLKEAEAQSFQLYHPQVDHIREHREPTAEESSARRRHKELVTEEMLDNEMAILAPFQEGMQALPSEEVANEGASGRSTWSDSRPSCETSTWNGRALTPARHWLRRWAPPTRP